MKVTRKIIEIDREKCDGCGQCVPSCAEGAIVIRDGKATVIDDKYCDGLGACLGECPQGALRLIEREADEFDEAAVEEMLQERMAPDEAGGSHGECACGCPSAGLKTFATVKDGCRAANEPRAQTGGSFESALGHWPVQIRLVPESAPFLKGADLLVAADCVPVAFPAFHRDFLKDRVVMIGCPKFDDTEAYVEKFTRIFETCGIKSITIVVMEVPCCSGLPGIVQKALDRSNSLIPVSRVVISARGEILE